MTSSGINWKHNVPWIVKLLFLFIASGLREMKIVTGLKVIVFSSLLSALFSAVFIPL